MWRRPRRRRRGGTEDGGARETEAEHGQTVSAEYEEQRARLQSTVDALVSSKDELMQAQGAEMDGLRADAEAWRARAVAARRHPRPPRRRLPFGLQEFALGAPTGPSSPFVPRAEGCRA